MQRITKISILKDTNLKNKKWLLYGIYCLVLTIVFLYLLFPSDILKNYFIEEIYRIHPGLKVRLDDINLSFPFDIKIEGLKISTDDSPNINIYESDDTLITPRIFAYLKGNSEYSFKSSTMGGDISGFVSLKDHSQHNVAKSRVIFRDIHLDKNVFIYPIVNDRLDGTLNGEINFTGSISSPQNGDCDMSLDLTDGKINLKNSILKLSAIDFHTIKLKAEMKNGKIDISDTELVGDGVKGNASGTIRLNKNFMASRLDLKGELELASSFFRDMPGIKNTLKIFTRARENGKLPFNVKGTIKEPLFNFSRL